MASTIKVDQIEGSTGSTITVPTGQTLTLTDGLASASLPVVGVAKGGTALSSFTAGDVLYATGATTLAKLAKGTAEQVLAMNSGATAPDWGSVDLTVLPTITVAKGGTNLSSFTAGDIMYATGATTIAKLAKGTTLQHLRMNAGATAPEWTAAPSSGLVGYATSSTFSTSTIASTSHVSLGLSVAYTPTNYSANKIMVQTTGFISQDNSDGQNAYMQVKCTGQHTTDFTERQCGFDHDQGQESWNLTWVDQDSALVNNSGAQTYTVHLRTGNASSQLYPRYGNIQVFEIGV